MDTLPLILAGGSGTRLWPLSRERMPKQLLAVRDGGPSLLQETVARAQALQAPHRGDGSALPMIVVCHEDQRYLTLDQLEESGADHFRILLEPASRNTAPALTYAAAFAIRDTGSDPILVAMPADHVIGDVETFRSAVGEAVGLAATGIVVTLGVVPTRAEAGYGYIRKGIGVKVGATKGFSIDAFVEKPGEKTAESYLASGKYLWNSGIFVVRASVWLEAIDRHRPDILSACSNAVEACEIDGRFVRVSASAFEACPSDSIDYAVMERISQSHIKVADDGREGPAIPAAVVPLDADWSDVGSWLAVLELGEDAQSGNALRGDVLALDTGNTLLHAEHRFVAAVGLRDTIVVETADAVLVASKDRCQDVRQVVDWLHEHGREEGRSHRRVARPWGSFELLDRGERFQVKRLTVIPGAAISLQLHHHRAEHWVVVRGTARVTKGSEEFVLTENESTYIPVGTRHRLENPGTVPLEVIEVQSGSYLGEDDIVRFEDHYGR